MPIADSDDSQPPILDFDPTPTAIIEATAIHHPIPGIPTRAVITWMGDAFAHFEAEHELVERHRFRLESAVSPIYEFDVDGQKILVTKANVGAPPSAALFEALIGIGCRTFVAVGSSGGLVPELAPGTVVVPDAAIRDEGISYHYAPPGLLAHHDPELQQVVASAYRDAGHQVATGLAWTTDAFYRETSALVAKRVSQGAIAVDMEVASLAAVAAFRNVKIGHALYLADTLHSDQWDATQLVDRDTAFRYRLLVTATAACAKL